MATFNYRRVVFDQNRPSTRCRKRSMALEYQMKMIAVGWKLVGKALKLDHPVVNGGVRHGAGV